MRDLLLEYDESIDAAYLKVSDAPWDHQVRLDDSRGIDYAADGSVIGIEILSPRRKGVRLDGLPFRADVARSVNEGSRPCTHATLCAGSGRAGRRRWSAPLPPWS
jgi:uncharacterized protein YuzE